MTASTFNLVLLIVVAALVYLYCRARIKLARYHHIYDDNVGPMLRVDLDQYRPVVCNPSFASLLGYSNPTECIELFGQYTHMGRQTFRQLYQSMQDMRQRVITMDMANRRGEVIASEVEIFVASTADFMELRLLPDTNPAYDACVDAAGPPVKESQIKDLLGCFSWELDLRSCRVDNDPSWLALLDYEALPETGQLSFWRAIVFPEDQSPVIRSVSKLLDGETDKLNIRYRLASGTGVEHWIETRGLITAFDEEGRPCRLNGIHRDITDQMYEGTVTAAREIDRKHDIANQLATVTGYAHLISESRVLPEKLVTYVHEIVEAGQEAQRLLHGRESEPEAGEENLVHAVKSVSPPIYNQLLHGQTDTSDVSRVLDAICLNALEAGSLPDQITLETGRKQLGGISACSTCEARPEDWFRYIRIHDAGGGIEPHHLPWVFKPGFTTRGISRERGMGLSDVNDRVHKLGGHIQLQSVVGQGTRVTIYLPESRPKTLYSQSPGSTNNHVLIVDDERSVLGYLKEIIEKEGYQVTTSTDACQALTMFREDPDQFNLVVTDQAMPGLPGEVMLQAMLETRPELPVIMCSGDSETMDDSVALAMGAKGYVRKPIDANRLLGLINRSLQDESPAG